MALLMMLRLPPSDSDHRRVLALLAVLTYLQQESGDEHRPEGGAHLTLVKLGEPFGY